MALKTVISASRRTDIPAFYLDWFIECLDKGYVEVANPFNPRQVRTVSLKPDHVEWIVFWSRHYGYFLRHFSRFTDYRLFFHFTILPNSIFDSRAPSPGQALRQMEKLAHIFGPEHIIWRYDPLVFWNNHDGSRTNHSPVRFQELCSTMQQLGIRRCYTSIVTPYAKFLRRIREIDTGLSILQLELERQAGVITEMAGIASYHAIQLYTCCNASLESLQGVRKGRCIDGALLNTLSGHKAVSEARRPTRPGCGCTASVDIGNYTQHPCRFGCAYCYANPAGLK